MANELIIKSKTEISTQSEKTDILTLYGVPGMIDQIIKKEKSNLFNNLSCATVIIDALNNCTYSEDFFVEIPSGLREMLRSGKATFDQSAKNPGSFTPNIRVKGEPGIKGQATIVQKTDTQAVAQSLSNLAMMAMVQSILDKLDAIEKKVDDIKTGQKNDRVGSIIGAFKGLIDLYSTFKRSEELQNVAQTTYIEMQKGLAQLHLQIDTERKKLNGVPTTGWQVFYQSITNPFHNEAERYQKCYEDYIYDIQLYNRLILLTDVVFLLMGKNEAIEENHSKMLKYCEEYIDDSFKNNMSYLMQGKIDGIDHILEYNKNLKSLFDETSLKDLRIECNKEDIKQIHLMAHGSQKH